MDQSISEQALDDLLSVIRRVKQTDQDQPPSTEKKRSSARNLVHYRAFRSEDISAMQERLGRLGLSRFARAEGHVLFSLRQVEKILKIMLGEESDTGTMDGPTYNEALRQLAENTRRLLGDRPERRRMMIMVTLPSEAATDPEVTDTLVSNGMNCARINCAHDDPEAWERMIQNARKAAEKQGRSLRIAMDLGGPKIRTSDIRSDLTDKKGRPFLLIRKGDEVILTGEDIQTDNKRHVIPMTLPEILPYIASGERVFFDDGKIEGIVRGAGSEGVYLEITKALPGGSKLRADKGINLPDSELRIGGLTAKDREDFAFVARHADIVNFSFVNTPADLDELYKLVDRHNAHKLGIILKIETKRAYNNLASLLLHTMQRENPFGVMIARGDLAIEAGWENMGYIQREILRTCTAAHLPIIWATQVLENLAKRGIPARSEMTDIAQSLKAECVMLNKGPFINEALQFLDQFLIRGEMFQQKNKSMLPSLHELI